jgi:P27 family predicted phage terminase small subunit
MTRAKWFHKPTDLSSHALAYWHLLGPGLLVADLLTRENAELFKILCRLLAAVRVASDEIERHGVTIETSAGTRKSNPALNALISAQRAVQPLMARFGLGE